MADETGRELLAVTIAELRYYRTLAEKALAQVGDDDLHATLDDDANSLAVLVRHVGNNLRSRWTDFLTTDGEKPDRHRDAEFEARAASRAELMAVWDDGWARLLETLESLTPEDLAKTVPIRSEPHTVPRAMVRTLAHVATHVGQIVLLARHLAGPGWDSLSVPRGASEEFNARMRAKFGGST
jgi:hypothetical protein